MSNEIPSFRRPEPGKLMGRGHGPGDSVHAFDWDVVDESEGFIEVLAVLPDSARNPRGTMFGGYTGLYVDLMALHTHRSGRRDAADRPSLHTVHMAIDYLAPVTSARFTMTGTVAGSVAIDRAPLSGGQACPAPGCTVVMSTQSTSGSKEYSISGALMPTLLLLS